MKSIITNGIQFYNEKGQFLVNELSLAQLYDTSTIKSKLTSMPKKYKNLCVWYTVDNIPDNVRLSGTAKNLASLTKQISAINTSTILTAAVNSTPEDGGTVSNENLSSTSITDTPTITQTVTSTTPINDPMSLINSSCATIISLIDTLLAYKSSLNNLLSMADHKVSDMYHYIEFNNLNASEGYKAYKQLHIILTERRGYKDALQAIQNLIDTTKLESVSTSLKERKPTTNTNKSYKVRELKDVLGNKLINNAITA